MLRTRFAVMCASVAIALYAAAPAAADIAYGGATSADVVAMLTAIGYPATPDVTGGLSNVKTRSPGSSTAFEVYFYNCNGSGAAARCGQLQFSAGFAFATNPALEVINKWNSENRWGRAYIDRSGVHVETDFDCSLGMTTSEFRAYLKHFEDMLPGFRRQIGYDS
jgi:hypothetical protein